MLRRTIRTIAISILLGLATLPPLGAYAEVTFSAPDITLSQALPDPDPRANELLSPLPDGCDIYSQRDAHCYPADHLTPTPEPASFLLMGTGGLLVLGLGWYRRRFPKV